MSSSKSSTNPCIPSADGTDKILEWKISVDINLKNKNKKLHELQTLSKHQRKCNNEIGRKIEKLKQSIIKDQNERQTNASKLKETKNIMEMVTKQFERLSKAFEVLGHQKCCIKNLNQNSIDRISFLIKKFRSLNTVYQSKKLELNNAIKQQEKYKEEKDNEIEAIKAASNKKIMSYQENIKKCKLDLNEVEINLKVYTDISEKHKLNITQGEQNLDIANSKKQAIKEENALIFANHESEIKEITSKIKDQIKKYELSIEENAKIKNDIQNLKDSIQKLSLENVEVKEKHNEIESKRKDITQKTEILSKDLLDKQEELKRLKDIDLKNESKQNEANQSKLELQDILEAKTKAVEVLETLKKEKNIELVKEEINDKLAKKKEILTELNLKDDEYKRRISDLRGKIEQSNNFNSTKEQEINDLKNKEVLLAETLKELKIMKNMKKDADNELDLLKNCEKEHILLLQKKNSMENNFTNKKLKLENILRNVDEIKHDLRVLESNSENLEISFLSSSEICTDMEEKLKNQEECLNNLLTKKSHLNEEKEQAKLKTLLLNDQITNLKKEIDNDTSEILELKQFYDEKTEKLLFMKNEKEQYLKINQRNQDENKNYLKSKEDLIQTLNHDLEMEAKMKSSLEDKLKQLNLSENEELNNVENASTEVKNRETKYNNLLALKDLKTKKLNEEYIEVENKFNVIERREKDQKIEINDIEKKTIDINEKCNETKIELIKSNDGISEIKNELAMKESELELILNKLDKLNNDNENERVLERIKLMEESNESCIKSKEKNLEEIEKIDEEFKKNEVDFQFKYNEMLKNQDQTKKTNNAQMDVLFKKMSQLQDEKFRYEKLSKQIKINEKECQKEIDILKLSNEKLTKEIDLKHEEQKSKNNKNSSISSNIAHEEDTIRRKVSTNFKRYSKNNSFEEQRKSLYIEDNYETGSKKKILKSNIDDNTEISFSNTFRRKLSTTDFDVKDSGDAPVKFETKISKQKSTNEEEMIMEKFPKEISSTSYKTESPSLKKTSTSKYKFFRSKNETFEKL